MGHTVRPPVQFLVVNVLAAEGQCDARRIGAGYPLKYLVQSLGLLLRRVCKQSRTLN
jgi:hypothetical protein